MSDNRLGLGEMQLIVHVHGTDWHTLQEKGLFFLWECHWSRRPQEWIQETHTLALWSEWERLQGRSPLMWLDRALSRARSRRILACSCLGLRGSSSLITRSDLTIKKTNRRNLVHTGAVGEDIVCWRYVCFMFWHIQWHRTAQIDQTWNKSNCFLLSCLM